MDANVIILFSLCLVFLVLSAFFSASETALFSIPRERIDIFQAHESNSRRLIYSLLMDGQRTLLLILLANLFVNITLTGLINSLVTAVLGKRATFWSFLLATAAIVAFGEILPKNGALRNNERIAAFAAPILHNLKRLTTPLLNAMQRISRFFLDIFKVHLRTPPPFITIDEVKSAVRSSCESGVISKSEQGVITNLLDKGAQPVRRFMIHRSRVPFVPHYATAGEAITEMSRLGRTFAFVTRGSRGHQVMGVVHLPQLLAARADERLRKFAREPQWAPETLSTAELISFMFAENQRVVCVLDEFGGTSGAFTLSDGLGRVMNFRDVRSTVTLTGNAKVFAGAQELDGMENWLPDELKKAAQNVRTLNGAITRHLGRIPKTGERFDIGGRNFYIMYSGDKRIESVLIRNASSEIDNRYTNERTL